MWGDWGLILEWRVKPYSWRVRAQLKTPLAPGKTSHYYMAVPHSVLTVWPYCKSSIFCVTTNWAFLFFTTTFPSNLDKASALTRQQENIRNPCYCCHAAPIHRKIWEQLFATKSLEYLFRASNGKECFHLFFHCMSWCRYLRNGVGSP